jgi:transposase
MIGLTAPTAIYFCTRATDMRKSIDGLSGEALNYMGRDSIDGSLFVFISRDRNKLKMLWWEGDGYWVYYKRLEVGTFQLPFQQADGLPTTHTHWTLSPEQLQLILCGIDLHSVRKRKRYQKAA